MANAWGTTYSRTTRHDFPAGLPAPAPPLAYVDTETSGLSGGTGTLIFAAAICWPDSGGLRVDQFFLRSPGQEPAFLLAVQEAVNRAPGIGTYNGARFDLPLLRTRWIMSRLPGEFCHPPHLDLLFSTRALFKQTLADCSLRTVEAGLLGLSRTGDLPGYLAPEAWFRYLRHGDLELLESALDHNRQDVLSLYSLHSRIERRVSGTDPEMTSKDWLALSRYWKRQHRPANWWRALRQAANRADGPAAAGAAVILARRLSRLGRPLSAARLLRDMVALLPAETALEVALATLLEWRLGAPLEARELVRSALERLPRESPYYLGMEARLARLERKARLCSPGRAQGSLPAAECPPALRP